MGCIDVGQMSVISDTIVRPCTCGCELLRCLSCWHQGVVRNAPGLRCTVYSTLPTGQQYCKPWV